ncbi:hypothetical protein [Acetonema longum]|uniref:Uncharacterized protein n=1 Tax=Acetonema longum DSM 6540 TaxID=1009370 RepID=F7NNT4_9FIRM|nr:hypothetical protein [Acetonema longum]EGO62268.1 hypothetical protein ALO_18877 [Acetonema longum DSM 6540]
MFLPNPGKGSISAILPCYTADGDSTEIIAVDGTNQTIRRRVRTVLRQIARQQAVDLTALKRQTARATGSANLQVLPLTAALSLFPVKVRTPRVSGDTCTGYVNALAVKAVEKRPCSPYPAAIILTGGREIPCLWTAATVEKYLRAARLLAALPRQRSGVAETPAGYGAVGELNVLTGKLIDLITDIIALKTGRY